MHWLAITTVALAGTQEVLEVTSDTTLDPARTYGRIVIRASGVTLDGRGAWLVGATEGDPKTFEGVAIEARGVSDVTLRGVNAKGWETGLHVVDGSGWTVEGCDFSGNFHDPSFGWGENGRRGGIVLERVTRSVVRGNRANEVWDACVLVECDDNTIEQNDFSHTSNTCLKLWNSSRNTVRANDLSYGLRISPGEVHARDSTGVLIESGSDDNRFLQNDCTHGGDGIFIRVLNGWVSQGNWFEGNDCSYANNNAFEAWAPRNTYVRNKANHSSYGFWLGASDKTVLIGNEAAYNGDPDGFHNSPHLPEAGHAGIVFMFGPSSHTIVRGNHLHDNNGAGVALIGHQETQGAKWKAFHWIVEQNVFERNRWGIYAQYADWVDVAANDYRGNGVDLHDAGGVTNLTARPEDPGITQPPEALVRGPSRAKVGEAVVLDASPSTDPEAHPLAFRWDLGDGTLATTATVEHAFAAPGFYRVGVTVNNGLLSDLGWRDLIVVADVAELGTEGQAGRWTWHDPASECAFVDDAEVRVSGARSLRARVEPYGGGRVTLAFPAGRDLDLPLAGRTRIAFWLKTRNPNLPAWQGENPLVTLHESEERALTLRPRGDFLSDLPYHEARDGWCYFEVPLEGDARWSAEGAIERVKWLSIGFDSWGAPPLTIWVDGLSIE